jgi:hypothetical protein
MTNAWLPGPGSSPPTNGRRMRHVLLGATGGLVVLLIGFLIGSGGPRSTGAGAHPTVTVTASGQPAPAVTVTVTAGPTAPKQAALKTAPKSMMSGNGVFVVGLDIRPGTYHTTGAVGGVNCYYALLSSTNTSDIVDNNNVTGPATIKVGPDIKAVQISGCNPWRRIGD